MRPFVIIAAAVNVAALLSVAGEAQAQAPRTFVSGHGEDTNPCTLAAPCRSFAQAITQTAAGGEIAVLDTAGYGAVTITQSVSIVNEEGVEAGIAVATATDGIDINVGASDVVNLRGLTLTGGGVGNNGIKFTNLGALNIQNCVIRGFTLSGIFFQPVGNAALNVSDTVLSNNSALGVAIGPTGSGAVTAALNRVQVSGALLQGINVSDNAATGTLDATIANSVASNNSTGIVAGSASGAVTQVMVSTSVLSNNFTGVADAGLNATIYLAKNTIAGNTTSFSAMNNASLFSFGDNYIKGNADDATAGAIPLVSAK